VKKILAVLILVSAISSVAFADMPNSLKGTWVIDAKATEEYLKNSSPKLDPKEAELFPLLLGDSFGIILNFNSGVLTTSTYHGDKSSPPHQLISQQNEQMKYIFKGDKDDLWTVSIINNGKNINIKATKNPTFEFCLWKRVNPDPKIKPYDNAKRVLEDYKTMLENIKSVPIIAARTEKWDDEALLNDGRTVEVHRQITLGGRNLIQGISTWPDTYSFEARNPDTGKTIKWSGERYVKPIMLDFVDGIPYLVVRSDKVFLNVKLYGCPEIPYAFLKYEQETSQWVPVLRNLAPKVLRMANLSEVYDGCYMMNGKRQTKEFIASRYRGNKGSSNGSITADIPENYDTWDYQFKDSYKNKRFKNDCRPPLPVESEVVLPTPQEVALEIMEVNDYNPVRVLAEDEWGHLVFDKERYEDSEYGKSLFKQADPNEPWMGKRFTKDLTGVKKVPYNKPGFRTGVHRLCDKNYILYYAHLELPNKMVITKYTVTGDMLYRISFQNPGDVEGFRGYINTPSVKSENGYLTFEWWHFRDDNHKWEIKRTLKVRLREPSGNNK
jgi:hypothetical protein